MCTTLITGLKLKSNKKINVVAVRDSDTYSYSSSTSRSGRSCRSLSTLEKDISVVDGSVPNTVPGIRTVYYATYSLSSVSLLAKGSDRTRGTWGTRSSRGTSRTSVTTLSLQEDTT